MDELEDLDRTFTKLYMQGSELATHRTRAIAGNFTKEGGHIALGFLKSW